jgi:hypothetical protein
LIKQGGEIMDGYYEIVTDGKVFRIVHCRFGGERRFVGIPDPLTFRIKEDAEAYKHDRLSMTGWHSADR